MLTELLLFCLQTKLRFLDNEFLGAGEKVQLITCWLDKPQDLSLDPQQPQKKPSAAAHTCSTSAEEAEAGRSLKLTGWPHGPAELVNSRFNEMNVPDNLWPPLAHVKTYEKHVYKQCVPAPHIYIFKLQKHENCRTGTIYDNTFFKKKTLT